MLICFLLLNCQHDKKLLEEGLSTQSIDILSYDSTSFIEHVTGPNSIGSLNSQSILKLVNESAYSMSKGLLYDAYKTNSSLLKSIDQTDSIYYQVLFHQFIIANEVDSLKECKRLVQQLGDSSNAGLTWQWQQTWLWMRIHARLWNLEEYEKQKEILLKLIKQHPDWYAMAGITYEQLGNYESNFRRPSEAFQFYALAIQSYRALKWKKKEILCKLRFADQLLSEGEISKALALYNEIPDIKNVWPEIQCKKLLFLSDLAYFSSNRKNEYNSLKEMLEFALKNNLIYWATEASTRLSSWFQDSKNVILKDSVLYYAKLTRRFATDMQDQSAIANSCIDLSISESLFGNYTHAIQYALDNLYLRRIQHNITEEINALFRLSELFIKNKNLIQAISYNDSALKLLEVHPEERPFLAKIFKQRAELESLRKNEENAFLYRKKFIKWMQESQKLGVPGFKKLQIQQLQSQSFVLSGRLQDQQLSILNLRRLNRYLLLSSLLVITILLFFIFSKWSNKLHQFKKLRESVDYAKFQLTSIEDDYQHEFNLLKKNGIEEGSDLLSYLHNYWRSTQLPETQKRLRFWLKALKNLKKS